MIRLLLGTALLTCTAAGQDVLLGIDVLQKQACQPLAGKKVGLVTNHTGRDRHGRRTVDVLHDSEVVDLRILFSPEHGWLGALDVARVDDAIDAATGLRVQSLYGDTRKPTAEMLEGLDALVFDIQDIGARFYTYLSTMGLCMEACREHGLAFFVLDRPNPLGGVVVAGPVRDPGRASFTAFHDVPVRHGMTAGELAHLFRAERWPGLELVVVPVQGWQRADLWHRTGLPWINPSPNMRSLLQALLYPGVALVEGTNLSVGRGTDAPFQRVGAPWCDGPALAHELNRRALPGVRFVPIRFTPSASKHKGAECSGIEILVTDWARFQSVRTGVHLIGALHALHPGQWQTERADRSLCHRDSVQALLAGKDPDLVVASWQAALIAFNKRRAPHLLYR